MKKIFYWIWFVLGCFGAIFIVTHSWELMNWVDAMGVTVFAINFMTDWLARCLAYQWNIPRTEWER